MGLLFLELPGLLKDCHEGIAIFDVLVLEFLDEVSLDQRLLAI